MRITELFLWASHDYVPLRAKNRIIRCREKKLNRQEDLAKPPKTSIWDILKVTTVIQDMTVYTTRLIT